MTHKVYRYPALLLILVLIMLANIAPAPVQAAVERELDIDNTLTEFDDGSFQITASAQFPSTPSGNDLTGAVQLAPIADLTGMTTGTNLPFARTAAGVVTLGTHIFVIGGIGPSQNNSSQTGLNSTVYVSKVDEATGGLSAWATTLALPSIIHSDDFPSDLTSERARVAVAALSTGAEDGYIYVIGGTFDQDISSYSVLRGRVVNGQVTSWNVDDPMPNVPEDTAIGPIGIESAAANIVTISNGNTYLYLTGGLRRYYNGLLIEEVASKVIFYAQIETSTGKFVGNLWNTTTFEIPGEPRWNAAVVGGTFEDSNGLGSNPALYILGGQSTSSIYRSEVYRAFINNDDGTISFPKSGYVASDPGAPCNSDASMGKPRTGHAAVQYNGAIYNMGGAVDGIVDPTRNVLGSYIQAQGCIPSLGGSTSTYFISNDGLPQPRIGHGAVLVPTPAANPTGAWVYAIGGSNGIGPQSTIFQTRIGNTSINNVRFPNDGWYIAKARLIPLANAKVKKIYWETQLSGGANVQIEYRVSADTDCSFLERRSDSQAPWQPTLTTASVTGLNEFPLQPLAANCFQYRAKLTPGGGALANQTPYLMRMGILIEVPGATDLTVTSFGFRNDIDGVTPIGLLITLHNENIYIPSEPTLAANYVPGATSQGTGSFFVDVFIYPPGASVPALDTHKPKTSPTQYARLSIDVLKSEIQAGDAAGNPVQSGGAYNFTIPADRPLCDYATAFNNQRCQPVTLGQLFPVTGTYTVVVVADGDNNIKETPEDAGKSEDNNVFSTQVTIVKVPTGVRWLVFLPYISQQ